MNSVHRPVFHDDEATPEVASAVTDVAFMIVGVTAASWNEMWREKLEVVAFVMLAVGLPVMDA